MIEIIKKGNWEKVVVLNDPHFPYHDPVAMDLAVGFCKYWKPDIVVSSEWEDFYDLSKFNQDPERIHNLQDEIDMANEYRGQVREVIKDGRFIYIESNHTRRLRTYMWHHAPKLSPLRCMELTKVLELDKHNVEYMDVFIHRNVLYKHGDLISVDSGMTARREFYRELMTGISGHSHRMGTFDKRVRGGIFQWIESGCLCDLNPEYVNGVANWQQGFVASIFNKDGESYDHRPIKILGDKLYWGDMMIRHKQ